MKRIPACIAAAVMLLLIVRCPLLHAARAVSTVTENRLTWTADGQIEATCHETEVIGGVVGN